MPRHRTDPDDSRIGHAYRFPHVPRHRGADAASYDAAVDAVRDFESDFKSHRDRYADPGTQLYLDVDTDGTPKQRAYADRKRALDFSAIADSVGDALADGDTLDVNGRRWPLTGSIRAIGGPEREPGVGVDR